MPPFPLLPHTHLLTLAGSRAYGIHTPTSDLDLKGVAIPPASFYHGFVTGFEQVDAPSHMALYKPFLTPEEAALPTKLEGSVYEIRKLFRLAAEANPNILDVLFCREEDVRLCTPIGRKIRDQRRLFLSARARFTFAGYAMAQLKRIETHRKWLLEPPTQEPVRGDFGLPERTVIPADQLAATRAGIQKKLDQWEIDFASLENAEKIALQAHIVDTLAELSITADVRYAAAARSLGLDDNYIELLDQERRYKAARDNWEHYHRWKAERNVDRAALEARHGYDTKHGAHLVRLLRMGREILEEGEVFVWRGDRDSDELKAIRGGAWSYDRLIGWAREQEEILERIYRAGSGLLPRAPDRPALDRLCVELVEEALAGGQDRRS